MNIYKFGGASVRDAESIKNILQILNTQKTNLIIVVSAMGKMTDALEILCNHYFNKTGETAQALQNIKEYHSISSGIFLPIPTGKSMKKPHTSSQHWKPF